MHGMLQLGKLKALELEMKTDVCGLAEVRWAGEGHLTTSIGHTVIYSGQMSQGKYGVGM